MSSSEIVLLIILVSMDPQTKVRIPVFVVRGILSKPISESSCEARLRLQDFSIDVYEGFLGPKPLNPSTIKSGLNAVREIRMVPTQQFI